jgi:hypothetical protein
MGRRRISKWSRPRVKAPPADPAPTGKAAAKRKSARSAKLAKRLLVQAGDGLRTIRSPAFCRAFKLINCFSQLESKYLLGETIGSALFCMLMILM